MSALPRHENSSWLFATGIFAAAFSILLGMGNPCERWEMRWLDQVLRGRLALGMTPAVDSRIMHLDLGLADAGTDAQFYVAAEEVIRNAAACGARVVAFDTILQSADPAQAAAIKAAIAGVRERLGCDVVLGEKLERGFVRSFPADARSQPAGFLDAAPDADGVYRHYSLVRWHDGELEPSLALAAYLLWKDVEWGVGVEPSSRGAEWTELPGNRKRLAATSPVLLNYRWPWDAERAGRGFRHCTRASLAAIAAAGKKELLETILIVAEIEREGPGSTPLGNEQPKALLHSTAINDLIQQSSLQRWPWYADALLLGFAVVGCVALRRVRSPRIVLAIWLCGGALLLLGSFVVIVKTNTVPGAMLAMTGWTTVCLLAATQRVLPSARELPVVPAGHLHFEVFISAASPSYGLAREVHDFLLAHGIAAFFCRRSLLQIGNANFGVAIDDALEQAAHMVVVATHAEDFRRGWFAREWRIFLEEMHSGRKGAGNLIMVSDGSLTPEKLPPPLRLFEMIPAPGGLDPLLAYVRPAADPQPGGPAGSSAPSHA